MRAFLLTACVLAIAACGGGEDDDLGVDEAAIHYYSRTIGCSFSGTQETIDTPPVPLAERSTRVVYRYGTDNTLLGTAPASPFRGTSFLRLFRSTGWIDSASAPGLDLANLLVSQNPKLAWFGALPAAPAIAKPRDFVAKGTDADYLLSDPFDYLGDSTFTKVVADGKEYVFANVVRTSGAVAVRLDKANTTALLKQMGASFTSTNLPAAGEFQLVTDGYCDQQQVHLPPEEDNGASFHLKFCCSYQTP